MELALHVQKAHELVKIFIVSIVKPISTLMKIQAISSIRNASIAAWEQLVDKGMNVFHVQQAMSMKKEENANLAQKNSSVHLAQSTCSQEKTMSLDFILNLLHIYKLFLTIHMKRLIIAQLFAWFLVFF